MANITKVAIVNIALGEMGASRITSLTDGSKNAGIMNAVLDFCIEFTLVSHPWNFAIKREADVAELGTTPAWGYDHAYQYPADCLRLLSIGKDGDEVETDYKIETAEDESRIIVTDLDAPIDLKYIYNVSNTQRYSPGFVLALVKVLKAFTAFAVTGKLENQKAAEKEMQAFLQHAQSLDGLEDTPDQYGDSTLEEVR